MNSRIETLLSSVDVQLNQVALNKVAQNFHIWCRDLSYTELSHECNKIKEILAEGRGNNEPEDPQRLYSWVMKQGIGMRQITVSYSDDLHLLACLREFITSEKKQQLATLFLEIALQKIRHNVHLLRGNIAYTNQNFEDNLVILLKNIPSSQFTEGLKLMLGVDSADNFFQKSAEERLEIINRLRHELYFIKVLSDHVDNGETALFLKISLNNDPNLIAQLSLNRIGQSFLPTEEYFSMKIARFMQTNETIFIRQLAKILVKTPNFFTKPPYERANILLWLLKNNDTLRMMKSNREEARNFFVKSIAGEHERTLQRVNEDRLAKQIMFSEAELLEQERIRAEQERARWEDDRRAREAAERERQQWRQHDQVGIYLNMLNGPRLFARPAAAPAQLERQDVCATEVFGARNVDSDLFVDLRCQITGGIIVSDAVKTLKPNDDYQYYTKVEIEKWVDRKHNNPVNRQPLERAQLIEATEEYRNKVLNILKVDLEKKGMSLDSIREMTVKIFDELHWVHPEKAGVQQLARRI